MFPYKLWLLVLGFISISGSTFAKTKLSQSLKQELKESNPNKRISFLVQLKPASKIDSKNYLKSLKDHARNTQKSILAELEEMKDSGLVNNVRSYYISNTLAVEGVPSAIKRLAHKYDNIEEISSNRVFRTPSLLRFDEGEAGVIESDVPWKGGIQQWSLEQINATDSGIKERASQLIYANADTGVEFNHPALVENYLGLQPDGNFDHNYSWWDGNKQQINDTRSNSGCGTNSQVPCDDNNHGTHTMSTAIGGLGLGVSPHSRWMACKNMDRNLGTPESYLGCLQFFLAPTDLKGHNPKPDMRPHVVGNSYGCPPEEGCSPTTFKYAMEAMQNAGIFMVVSAGNDGAKGCSSINTPPATDPNSFNVAASGYLSESRAKFSSVGPIPGIPNAVDITAPGVNITGAVRGGKYDRYQGTSMAAPHVAGAALLIMAACPHLERQVEKLKTVIRDTATRVMPKLGCGQDKSNSVPNNEFGFGIINVGKAIQYCQYSNLADSSS